MTTNNNNSCIRNINSTYLYKPYTKLDYRLPFKIIASKNICVKKTRGSTIKEDIYLIYRYGYGYSIEYSKFINDKYVILIDEYKDNSELYQNIEQTDEYYYNIYKTKYLDIIEYDKFKLDIEKIYKKLSNGTFIIENSDYNNKANTIFNNINNISNTECDNIIQKIIEKQNELIKLNLSNFSNLSNTINSIKKNKRIYNCTNNKQNNESIVNQGIRQGIQNMNISCPTETCKLKKRRKVLPPTIKNAMMTNVSSNIRNNLKKIQVLSSNKKNAMMTNASNNKSEPKIFNLDDHKLDEFILTNIKAYIYEYNDYSKNLINDDCINICKQNSKNVITSTYLKDTPFDFLIIIKGKINENEVIIGFSKILIKNLSINLIDSTTIDYTVKAKSHCKSIKKKLTNITDNEKLIEYYNGKIDSETPQPNTTYLYIDVICSDTIYKYGYNILKFIQRNDVVEILGGNIKKLEWIALRALDHVYYYYPKFGFKRMMPGYIFPLIDQVNNNNTYPYLITECEKRICNYDQIHPKYFVVYDKPDNKSQDKIKNSIDSYTNGYFFCKKIENDNTNNESNRKQKALEIFKKGIINNKNLPLYIYYCVDEEINENDNCTKFTPYYFPEYIIQNSQKQKQNININSLIIDDIIMDGDGDYYIEIKEGLSTEDPVEEESTKIKRLYAHYNIEEKPEIDEYSWYFDDFEYISIIEKKCKKNLYKYNNIEIFKSVNIDTKLIIYYKDKNGKNTEKYEYEVSVNKIINKNNANKSSITIECTTLLGEKENIILLLKNYNMNCLNGDLKEIYWKIKKT